MKRMVFGCFAAGSFLGSAGAGAKPGRRLGGSRSAAGDDHCNAARGYTDKEDDDSEYVILLSYSKEAIVFAVVYDDWEWEKVGKILRAVCRATDDKDIMKKAKVEVVDKVGISLTFEFKQSIMGHARKAKLLKIDFEDDEDNSVEIKIPRMGEALAALKFCEENKK